MSRADRLRRAFPAYYAVSLVLLLGTVQVAQAYHRAAPAVHATPSGPAAAVMEPPPKPGVEPSTSGHGGGAPGEQPVFTLERCQRLEGDVADACYGEVARNKAAKDPDAGLSACSHILDAELRLKCVADVAEDHAVIEVAWSRATCETIPSKKWRDQCVFGISNAFALVDPTFALRNCEDAGQWKPFCRHDVNGERATVDPEAAMAYCAALPVNLQNTCWHGIGKYIGRNDEAAAAAWCSKVPTDHDFRGQCFHGLGWAAAEKDGVAAIDRCDGYADQRDSCVLGVAYEQWRYDPESAARLCERAGADEEKRRCLDFMSGN